MPDNNKLFETMKEWVATMMHNSFHEAMRFSRETGWSMTQLQTLMIIHKRKKRTVSEIGEELGVSNAATSQLLERMVQDGLILRSEDSQDRRVKLISLTERGLKLIQDNITARESWMASLSEKFDEQDQEQIICAFRLLIDRAKEHGYSRPHDTINNSH